MYTYLEILMTNKEILTQEIWLLGGVLNSDLQTTKQKFCRFEHHHQPQSFSRCRGLQTSAVTDCLLKHCMLHGFYCSLVCSNMAVPIHTATDNWF